MLTIAADPRHLGARSPYVSAAHLGLGHDTSSARAHDRGRRRHLTERQRWIAAKPNFFLPVLVLSKLFRRLMLQKFVAVHEAGKLKFFGEHAHPADGKAFATFVAPLKRTRWFVYCQAALRRPEGRARLPLPLYPSRRHLEPATDRSRRDQCHVQGQGLPDRRAWPVYDDDAGPAEFIRRFLSTSCRRAFTASGITGCSQALPKPRWSPRRASCFACPQPNRTPTRTL